jgi:rSAM/selenodomain-associated transferase 1
MMVFAKAPVAGRVKTRLVPPLSPQAAAALHTAFVGDTIESLEALSAEADVELHVDIETAAWPEIRVLRRLQHEGDLGLKMFKALDAALASGRPRSVILGGDSPTLSPCHLRAVLRCDSDIALGPTEDGGYYAIMAARAHFQMFDDVRWSTAFALEDTLRSCAACGLSTMVGPQWFDVDSGADLERLRNCRTLPRRTREALQSIHVPSPLGLRVQTRLE